MEHVTKIVRFLSEERDMYIGQYRESPLVAYGALNLTSQWNRDLVFMCVNINRLIPLEKKINNKWTKLRRQTFGQSQAHLTLCYGGSSTFLYWTEHMFLGFLKSIYLNISSIKMLIFT